MKRTLALFTLILCLVVLFTGCVAADTADGTGSEGSAESTYGPLSGKIIEMLQEENFTLEILMSDGGSTGGFAEMTLVQQLPNYAMKFIYDGDVSRVIMQEGGMYLVSDIQQTALNLTLLQLDPEAYEIPNIAEITSYRGGGTDTVNGQELTYEEYDVEEGVTARYYFDGEEFVYIVNQFAEEDEPDIVMEIVQLSNQVDESIFQIPDSYQRIETMDDLAAQTAP